jgi:exodeoxyribonuclease V alpha subunit
MKKLLKTALHRNGILSWMNIHFAQFISNYCPESDPEIFLAAALVSRAVESGDVCLDLHGSAESTILEGENGQPAVVCPPIDRWLTQLSECPAVGKPGDRQPLVLDSSGRLYLYRYWEYEKILAELILDRAVARWGDLNIDRLKKSLSALFSKTENNATDWQKIAAATAVLNKICVITGGPGTGKTHTITRILALLLEQAAHHELKICLAAPTGKAAARLQESIRQTIQSLNCDDRIKKAIPTAVNTIHRLLGSKSGSPYFHYSSKNPLPADIVIVDEASMVDLALMSKLIQAVPETARLVLIGDKDQLASVEAGSVLGDICDRDVVHGFSEDFQLKIRKLAGEKLDARSSDSAPEPGLQDCIVVLNKSYRFAEESPIGKLSRWVNLGKADKALELLKDSGNDLLKWINYEKDDDFRNILARKIVQGYSAFLRSEDPLSALEHFGRFKILCALRIGPFGVTAINHFALDVLKQHKLIHIDSFSASPWYRGRPILITRNSYNLGLFNGDIGIAWPAAHRLPDDLYVFFPDAEGRVKRYPTHSLPEHETVFALTVHKSQGSEFDEIALVLPDRDYPVLSRELLYTGMTRAKQQISIWAPPVILRNTITRKIDRASGLRESLWNK